MLRGGRCLVQEGRVGRSVCRGKFLDLGDLSGVGHNLGHLGQLLVLREHLLLLGRGLSHAIVVCGVVSGACACCGCGVPRQESRAPGAGGSETKNMHHAACGPESCAALFSRDLSTVVPADHPQGLSLEGLAGKDYDIWLLHVIVFACRQHHQSV